ncbi:PucR family transcriptional regulator [Enterococcus sp. AZ072]|uniref:PucR family transcriptional regulator n=1 Tax=unclassified Enterococcus TaxID=2608891 RepID=UPI003D2C182E
MKLDQIFREFIHVVQENPDYVIGLLNEKGKIVFCSLEEKIGDQVAINETNPSIRIYEILVSNKKYGYLWINGPEQAINVVGNILFDSLKTRIQYELNQQSAKESLSVDDQLIKEFLREERTNYRYTEDLMKKIKFDSTLPRIPICIINEEGFDNEEITGLKYKINDRSTIYSLLNTRYLLIFKSIPKKIAERKVLDYVETFINELIEWGLSDCYYAVGSIQSDTDLYNFSYNNCLWLKENVSMEKDQPIYFEDNLFSYFASKSSRRITSNVFDYYKRKADQIDVDEFIQVIEQLYLNDFSVKKTAEKLFLHKNTLLYKIKRYEEIFHLDIRGSFQGKLLVYFLADFFKNDKSRKQVGEK